MEGPLAYFYLVTRSVCEYGPLGSIRICYGRGDLSSIVKIRERERVNETGSNFIHFKGGLFPHKMKFGV